MNSNVIREIGNWLFVGVLASVLMACAGQQVAEDAASQQDYVADDTVDVAGTESANGKMPSLDKVAHHVIQAVHDLWEKAEAARKSGNVEAAIVQLERALRIDPNDAVIWSRLAEIRLEQGNTNQAEQLAAKSNAMTADNPVLNYRNWIIIARARQMQGDEMGAQEAEYTAKTFIQN